MKSLINFRMSDLPLVSIVVVSYNQGKYIRENLDSLKAQTYPNIELIVADDASQDNSVEVFNEWLFKNNYPAQTNYHTKNTGLATTLNECVEMVTGKYVKFIAADDFLHPESIERCVKKLEELGEEYGMVFTDIYAVDDDSKPLGDIMDYNRAGLVDREVFRRDLRKGNRIAALSVLMRLNVLKETGPYSSDMLVEDYQKWLQINEDYYIAYIPEKLCYYRQHINNISKSKAAKIAMEDLYLRIKYDKYGDSKKHINDNIQFLYSKKMFLRETSLVQAFIRYPFRNKTLGFCIENKLPFLYFRILNKLGFK